MDDPFQLLSRMWPGEWPPDVADEYTARLVDIDPDLLRAAVGHFLNTSPSPYRPSIGQLRCRIAEATCGFPTEDDALAQAREYALWRNQRRIGGADYPQPAVHPSVKAAVRSAGIEHLGAWLKAWRTERDRWVEVAAATPGCEPPPALTSPARTAVAAAGESVELRALPLGGES